MKPGWFKFPDNLISDQRICRIGQQAAITALIAAYSHAEKEESDGFVPRGVPAGVSSEEVVSGLISAGFFEAVPGGLKIVGFLDINATHERREAERAATLKRVEEFRKRKLAEEAEKRRQEECNGVNSDVSNGARNASGMRDEGLGNSQKDFPPSAAPVKPEDSPSKPKKPRPPDPVWEDYRERYKRSTGEEPIPQKHFFIQLARIRKQLSDAQIIGRLVTYFEDPPFNLSSGARDFGRFLARIDELAPMIQSNGHVQLMPPPERV